MKTHIILTFLLLAAGISGFGQVGVNNDSSLPDASAMLDAKSSGAGVLVPRMTAAERDNITNPALGLLIFCTSDNQYYYNQGSPSAKNWILLSSQWTTNGSTVYLNTGIAGIGTSAPTGKLEIGTWTSWTNPALRFSKSSGKDIRVINDENGLAIRNFTGTTACMFNVRTSDDVFRLAVNYSGSVGIGTGTPDTSAVLHANSTAKGFLVPRMTQSQIKLMKAPANGLTVFCTTNSTFYTYISDACTWKEILYGTGAISPSCGFTITKNHVAGSIAPVTKTVTYGTRTNVLGEPAKCWIISNLGATHPASESYDNTEPPAGWYFQFNRMRGYMHDGTTRTPGTTWNSGISENSEWAAANDPCALELGIPWRIPTYSEWENVKNAYGWSYDYDPWLSPLKLHNAGLLDKSAGALHARGYCGDYWSSTQSDLTGARELYFDEEICITDFIDKAAALPLRCLKDN
jgi:hypothetical protein